MSPAFHQMLRRLRFGAPIVIVSGLPRSGTSMTMKMLEAGGMELVTDGTRAADESNPRGYFELERVLTLDKSADKTWLEGARGKAIKIISMLLTHLPEVHNYRVIFMRRHLQEVIVSQNKMLVQRGEADDTTSNARMIELYEAHLNKIARFLSGRGCFEVLEVEYKDVLDQPVEQARRINRFLGGRLDTTRMAAVVEQELYRNRASS